MPRPLRIEYPHAWYHVMNRGAGYRKIFTSDYHRKLFLQCLEEATEMFGIQIHAFCLMDNHYHLLVCTPNANLSRAMRHINGVYTQRFNRTRKTDGPLFRGRYKAKLIDEDCYQLLVSRYIHLNPVEAKLVKKPNDYRWSSYKAYLGQQDKPNWLMTDVITQRVKKTKSLSHVKNYKEYVEKYDFDEISTFISNKYTSPILGSDEFKDKIVKLISDDKKKASAPDIKRIKSSPSIQKIMNATAEHYSVALSSLKQSKPGKTNWPKLICIYICRKKFGYSLTAIANVFKPLSHVTISTSVCKCEKLLKKYHDKHQDINAILEKCNLQGDT